MCIHFLILLTYILNANMKRYYFNFKIKEFTVIHTDFDIALVLNYSKHGYTFSSQILGYTP